MYLWPAAALGSVGGLAVVFVTLWANLTAWQRARHRAILSCKPMPNLKGYIDPLPDLLVAVTRLALGGLAGAVFHNQINGIPAAITVGASAPMLLWQLGAATNIEQIIAGSDSALPAIPASQMTKTVPAESHQEAAE